MNNDDKLLADLKKAGFLTGPVLHVTPAIDENCDHEWPDEDEHGTCGCCSKCGLSFMRYINSCCP